MVHPLRLIVSTFVCAVLLLAGSAVAQSEFEPQKLAAGDRVQVTVFQQPELSGDFIVDITGAIILPVVGAIKVQDLTIVEAEQRLTQRLGEGYMDRPVVSLKINEQRPIHVLGDVRSPGSYPYRYGASVLSAVALAGGLGAFDQASPAARSDFLQADERLRVAQANHRALFIRRLRLEAQRTGGSKIELPAEGAYSPGDPEVARILKEEQDILSVQRAGHEQTLRLLRDQKPRLEAEIASVKAQAEAETRQLQLLQEHIADYNKLLTSGLARRYAMIELQREEARHKGNLARFAADLARLEIGIGEIGVRIQEAENEYMRRIFTELQETRARLQEADISIPVAQELRDTRLQQSQMSLLGLTADGGYTVAILRSRSGREEVIQAEASTRLAPGDIIEVRRKDPQGAPGAPSLIGGIALQAREVTGTGQEQPLD